MTNKCNVARDLMPLVIDGVASEESQQYVDEHIAECTECALTYGAMRVELPRANQEKERAEMEKAAKKLRRKHILRGIVGTVLSVMIVMACYFGIQRGLNWHAEKQIIERYICENGDLKLEALYYDASQQPGDLRVQVDIHSFPSGNLVFKPQPDHVVVNDGTGICVRYRAVYAPDDERGTTSTHNWSGRVEDGVWMQFADDLRDENGRLVSLPIVRVELCAGEDSVVLWELGDELQTPEEAEIKRVTEMEKYLNKNK